MSVIIDTLKKKVISICKKYHVKNLYIFGSVTSKNFPQHSDIDFIVSYKTIPLNEYADNFFNFKNELKTVLEREIDIIEEDTITNPYFLKEIPKNRQKIYG